MTTFEKDEDSKAQTVETAITIRL